MSQNPEMKEITEVGLKSKLAFLKNRPILNYCADYKSFYLIKKVPPKSKRPQNPKITRSHIRGPKTFFSA